MRILLVRLAVLDVLAHAILALALETNLILAAPPVVQTADDCALVWKCRCYLTALSLNLLPGHRPRLTVNSIVCLCAAHILFHCRHVSTSS